MWLSKIFTAAMVTITSLLPSSCTKAKVPAAQQHAAIIAIANSSITQTNQNLGELQLTNHYETCVNLGAGRSCTIKPSQLSRSNIQLTMALESKNNSGNTKNLSVIQVVTKAGKPFEVAVGGMNLTLVPMMAQ